MSAQLALTLPPRQATTTRRWRAYARTTDTPTNLKFVAWVGRHLAEWRALRGHESGGMTPAMQDDFDAWLEGAE